ncbi:uncharacterized protein LOC126740678 [Anthonomus grandis grandis]|uniref:uncharacterized protein LOC126740678 n=1 Tax=Anthonomus grandis grandis TaxID=2921223 RepID=UPI002165E97E|nr:uncharacterized protein LOC126740678 [Anthonomus grandis grandis]
MSILQKTHLGWIVSGPLPLITTNSLVSVNSLSTSCNLNVSNKNIENQLERFWELENCSSKITRYSREESECKEHFCNTFMRDETGRFVVSLPFKQDVSILGDSKETAIKRFYGLEKMLNKNSLLREQYSSFMKEYISLGHMSLKNESNPNEIVYFLPHHCVLKETSQTTKCRVVFDASAKTTPEVVFKRYPKGWPYDSGRSPVYNFTFSSTQLCNNQRH